MITIRRSLVVEEIDWNRWQLWTVSIHRICSKFPPYFRCNLFHRTRYFQWDTNIIRVKKYSNFFLWESMDCWHYRVKQQYLPNNHYCFNTFAVRCYACIMFFSCFPFFYEIFEGWGWQQNCCSFMLHLYPFNITLSH